MDQCTLYIKVRAASDLAALLTTMLPVYSMVGDLADGAAALRTEEQELTLLYNSLETDGDDFAAMLEEMYDFFASTETEAKAVQASLLEDIRTFNAALTVVAEEDMDDATFGSLMGLAGELDGLILLPPGDLYNSEGQLVLNSDGESDF